MSSIQHKLVIKNDSTSGIHGIQTLNGIPQPLMDNSGNIDMSSNFLKVKNMEAGVEEFTTNGDIGVINVFSDSTVNNVSCINFKHARDNIGGNNRRYCSFDPSNNTNTIAGSITGNNVQVSFNTTSDSRLKNVITNSGTYISDNLTNTGYSTWLGSVNSLNPCIYSYKSDIVGTNNETFTYKKTIGGSDISTNYQGFLANEVQTVYPPAVTGISGETININGEDMPVYQQVDMTKLIPMMVGAIKELSTTVTELSNNISGNDTSVITELSTTVNELSTKVSNLTTLSILNPIWNDWTVEDFSDSIRCFITTDITKGIYTYYRTNYSLNYESWGVNSNDLKMTPQQQQSYLNYQLSQDSFKYSPVNNVKFIYNFSSNYNIDTNLTEYSYNYYIVNTSPPDQNVFVDLSVNNSSDISGVVGIIYDLDFQYNYNIYQTLSILNSSNYIWNHTTVIENKTELWYSTFINETNSLSIFYDNIQPNLTSTYWGINQDNTTILDKKTYLYDQISNNNLIDIPPFLIPPNNQFIYDYSYNNTTYNYSYYTVNNGEIIDSSFNGTDPSGNICLLYEKIS